MSKYDKIRQNELVELLDLLKIEADELKHRDCLDKLYRFNRKVYRLFNALSVKAEGISDDEKRQAWCELTTLHKRIYASERIQVWLNCFNEIRQCQLLAKIQNYPTSRRLTQYATRQAITEFCGKFKTNTAITLNFNPEMWGNRTEASIRTNIGNTLLPKIIGSYRTATIKNGSREKIAYIGTIEHLSSNVHVHLAVYNPKFKNKDLSYDAAKEEAFLLTDTLIKKTGGGSACVTPLLSPAGWATYITKAVGCCENLVFDPFSKSRIDMGQTSERASDTTAQTTTAELVLPI